MQSFEAQSGPAEYQHLAGLIIKRNDYCPVKREKEARQESIDEKRPHRMFWSPFDAVNLAVKRGRMLAYS